MEHLLNLEVVYFVHKQCGRSWRVENRGFPIFGFLLVLEGSADYVLDGAEYHVEAGSMVNFRPGCSRLATTTGMTCAAFDFTLRTGSLELPPIHRYTHTEELDRLLRDFQFEWLQKGEGYRLRCGAMLLLILHQLLHGGNRAQYNRHVERIKRHIADHYTEPTQVSALARLVGLSPVYCGALFHRTQGMTIAEYANRIRVHKAAALLEEQDHGITQVAYLCGFNDVYYFSSTFKRLMGDSPSRYRAHHTRSVTDIPVGDGPAL